MLAQKRRKLLTMAGVGAALGCGLVMGSQTASFAEAPAVQAAKVTVTPSTGLGDGAKVQVAASGFPANGQLTAGQCAEVQGKVACNGGNQQKFSTDADGSGSAAMTVNLSFEGSYTDGSGSAGTVNCADVACFIGVGDSSGQGVNAPITFA